MPTGRVLHCPHCGEPIIPMVERAGVTPVLAAAYDAIVAYTDLHGYAPTYDDLRAALGIKSKGRINRIVLALRERGYINYTPRMKRSISIVGRAA